MVIKINPSFCPANHPCPVLGSCPVGAIIQVGYGVPSIDTEKCIDCGRCTKMCATFYED